MNARLAAVLVALLVVLGGAALLLHREEAEKKPTVVASLGQPVLPGLPVSEVAAIALRDAGGTLTLERSGEEWRLAEREGFPADTDRVREFVLKLAELKIGQLDPAGEADRKRLQLDDSGTRVELRDAQGKTLAALVVGRKYFRKEPEDPVKALADGRFVARAEQPETAYIVADALAQASVRSADWILRTGVSAEKIRALESRPPQGESWRIERPREDADWTLVGARAGEKLEITRANAAFYSLTNLDLADVAPKDLPAAAAGLDRPHVLVAHTFEGLTYTFRIGRREGENYYLRFSVSGEPRPQGKDAEERAKKLAARLAHEKRLSAYLLLVPKTRIEDALKGRAELLAVKTKS